MSAWIPALYCSAVAFMVVLVSGRLWERGRSAVIRAGGEVGESGNEPAHADRDEGETNHGLGHVCEVHRGFLCCALERVLRGASVGEVRHGWWRPPGRACTGR